MIIFNKLAGMKIVIPSGVKGAGVSGFKIIA
jgi:hypothetical protein